MTTPVDELGEYEAIWKTPREEWSKEQWQRAAEGLNRLTKRLYRQLDEHENPRTRSRGRPPKFSMARFFGITQPKVPHRRPVRRPQKEGFPILVAIIDRQRDLLPTTGGRQPTDKAAIERWLRVSNPGASLHSMRRQVSRYQKLLSRARHANRKPRS